MSSSLKNVMPQNHNNEIANIIFDSFRPNNITMPISPKISRGVRVLPPKVKETASEEYQALQKDIQEIEQWWKDSRWEHTTRTFSGMQ